MDAHLRCPISAFFIRAAFRRGDPKFTLVVVETPGDAVELWLSIFTMNPPISDTLRSSLKLEDSIRWREELRNFY